VKAELERLEKLVGTDRDKIIGRIPYIGLDIEELTEEYIRVEYSPNRPDFGSDIGIARALRGILCIEKGLPRYRLGKSSYTVTVDKKVQSVRPYVACVLAVSLSLSVEEIRQLISLQEDLNQGLGRKRARVAIGLHDASKIENQIYYKTVGQDYTFQPLGQKESMPIAEILERTEQGLLYGNLIRDREAFPILEDSRGNTLSMPPVINSSRTMISQETDKIFVDVTSTDKYTGAQVLNILATTLHDMGGKLKSVEIVYPDSTELTPNLNPSVIRLDKGLVERVTGLTLSNSEIAEYLSRCRLKLKGENVYIPCYRVDIIHPVDIAEEVALGYGIDMFEGIYPAPPKPGEYNRFEKFIEIVSDFLAMSGLLEVMEYELTDRKTLIDNFSRDSSQIISVMNPKSQEHSLLRDSLIPSLLSVLSRNVKEEYPQRIFEVGRVFLRKDKSVDEHWNLCVMICHSKASYSEAKSYLTSLLGTCVAVKVSTEPSSHWAFSEGRTASITASGKEIGVIGEIKPEPLRSFGIYTPVSGFEVNLSMLYDTLNSNTRSV
jgi:phenylalanyl-tRNA synthetase beta chain